MARLPRKLHLLRDVVSGWLGLRSHHGCRRRQVAWAAAPYVRSLGSVGSDHLCSRMHRVLRWRLHLRVEARRRGSRQRSVAQRDAGLHHGPRDSRPDGRAVDLVPQGVESSHAQRHGRQWHGLWPEDGEELDRQLEGECRRTRPCVRGALQALCADLAHLRTRLLVLRIRPSDVDGADLVLQHLRRVRDLGRHSFRSCIRRTLQCLLPQGGGL